MAGPFYLGSGGQQANFMPSPPRDGGGPPHWHPPGPRAPDPTPGNPLGAQAVRATGPTSGFDPSYLQNLATSAGGLFSHAPGQLAFNPLGNLGEISPGSGAQGNAPGYGLPQTWLQQALLNQNFGIPQTPPATPKPQKINNPYFTATGGVSGL